MNNKRIIFLGIIVLCILLVPIIAMQFTNEVNWTLHDFVVAGGLLFVVGLMIDLVLRKVDRPMIRLAYCVVLLVVLMLTWAQMAVGIF